MNNNKNKDGNKEASRKMLLNVPLSLHNALILSQAFYASGCSAGQNKKIIHSLSYFYR